jgi:thioredoxin reductase (NADPH)
MPKPVILVVDDDETARYRLERDLDHRYGERYRIVGVPTGRAALDRLSRLAADNAAVALLLVDQRLVDMTGIELIQQASAVAPVAKRVLLTTYQDSEAAVAAIKRLTIDHYLLKPWQPPEQNLYPALDDLLVDWEACVRPPFEGLRVVGYRFSPESHQTRDFLASNCVPFEWLDLERDPEARRLVDVAGVKASDLPLVQFPDGTKLVRPTNAQIAEKLGLRVRPTSTFYDLVIVGGGPAGLAAAVYGASDGLRTVMVERHAPGGQAALSSMIENYLGFPAGLTGADLARRAVAQAKKFEVEIVTPRVVTGLRVEGSLRTVVLNDGAHLGCHVVLIATGVEWRRLDAPGIDRLTGAGVYYGGTLAEAFFCRNEDVAIVGGGNSAGQAALHFARYARTVTLLAREASLSESMSQYLIEQLAARRNVMVRLRTTVVEVHGTERLETITVADATTGKHETLRASALFIFIGGKPNTTYVGDMIARDDSGFILTGPDLPRDGGAGHRPREWPLDRDPFWLESSVPGVFVAGDVRHGSVKRVAAGVGEGATAVQFIHRYLRSPQRLSADASQIPGEAGIGGYGHEERGGRAGTASGQPDTIRARYSG